MVVKLAVWMMLYQSHLGLFLLESQAAPSHLLAPEARKFPRVDMDHFHLTVKAIAFNIPAY
jgi:hypothetical protein